LHRGLECRSAITRRVN